MKAVQNKMSVVAQNVLLGTITGSMVAYNLRLIYTRVGGTELIWVLFFILGPIIGYLSGKERMRLERLKNEKKKIEEDLDKIQAALKRSSKKYRLLVEHANDAIFLTTAGGRFLLFNEATSTLSGYNKQQLKNMNISKLKVDDNISEKHRKAWLDNGIYRYEEIWRNKDGDNVYLDINAKWIQLGEHQLILHVARDVIRQSDAKQEDKIQDVRHIHEEKLLEMSAVQDTLCRVVSAPFTRTVQMIRQLMKEYPEETERLSNLLSEWGSTQKLLVWLPSKSSRDMKASPCRWDLNEILKQEIRHLEVVTRTRGFLKQVSFAPDLPWVFGFGRDFSIAFSTIFRAILKSVENSDRRQFSISTKALDDHNLVEIRLDGTVNFKEYLCHVTDPFFKEDESHEKGNTELGFIACQRLFESLGARMDAGQEGTRTIIRIRVPSIQEEDETKGMTLVEGSKHSLII
jgi:PAS domain S-box-containing protein